MVMVFDENGQQMPEYQGRKEDVMEKIQRDAPPRTPIVTNGEWDTLKRT